MNSDRRFAIACEDDSLLSPRGVILVSISALINFAWANIYPFWSLTLLAIDFFILYAIIAHGSELKAARATE